MGKLVQPEVFLVGYTTMDLGGMTAYLEATGKLEFLQSIKRAIDGGLNVGEVLTSFYAKLCYDSLVLGNNQNLSAVREIQDNLRSTLDTGHGSVWEHVTVNFVATNVSRVFTHEIVRHRAGTAFSQTSGRYVRTDRLDIVQDPILAPVQDICKEVQRYLELQYAEMVRCLGLADMKDFNRKKKLTSALRRYLPNGQSNEIGFTMNLRTLRHTIQIRTAAGAEWEIRNVFAQVYNLLKPRYPMMFADAKEREVDGSLEIYGMKLQPYERAE